MKTNVQIVEIKKTLKRTLIAFVFLLQYSSSFTQVNPWENKSTENPWKVEEKNQPEITEFNSAKDSIAVASDSITQVNSHQQSQEDQAKSAEPVQNTIALEQDSAQYLRALQQKTRQDFRAPVAFIGSFLTSGVFLIFAVPFNLISPTIPTSSAKEYMKDYSEKHPKATRHELNAVKKGIIQKRVGNTAGGTVLGFATGAFVWVRVLRNLLFG